MVTAASRRIPNGVAWGALGVLAWAAFSILTGGGAAHADEEPDSPLGELTGLVSSTLEGATAFVVEPVVVEVVAPVVQKVVAPVVQTVVEPVAQAVPAVDAIAPAASDTAAAVVDPVTDVLQESRLSHATGPILSATSDVPVVGQLLDGLGVTTGLTDLVGAVDTTGGLLGDTVDATVLPIVGALDPAFSSPTDPAMPTAPVDIALGNEPIGIGLSGAMVPDERTVDPRAVAMTSAVRTFDPFSAATASAETAADATGVLATLAKAAHAPPASPAPSSSAGNGGGHAGDGAQLRADELDLLHAWTRVHDAPDDELPSSPVADTDVSPD